MNAVKRCCRGPLVLAISITSQAALAGYSFEDGALKGELNFSAGAAYIDTRNVNFGAGRVDARSGENQGTKVGWQELYIKPGIKLSYGFSPDFEVLGGASFVSTKTFGDGDAGGFTRSGDSRTSIEEGYVGFRAGDCTVTGGRQNFLVGNGFIVQDGNLDLFGDGAYWLAPRTAFRDSGIVAWQHGDWKAQGFSLRTDDHFGDVRMNGVNLDYTVPNVAILGAMVMQVDSLDRQLNKMTPRDGMQVYNLRALNAKLPGIENLTLNGEYALERGSGQGTTFDANAWYVRGDYAFNALPLQPVFGYRYASFSGDSDPTDNKRKSWDPLSKGYSDWGTWLVGDVVGNYVLFNSNEQVHTWQLKGHLSETVTVGGLYYQFSLNEKNFLGAPVNDRRFADEAALYLEWTPTPSVYTSVAYNRVTPKAAAKQALGDKPFNALEIYVTYRY